MKNVWLIGAGGMAQDYISVLQDLDCNFKVIGRSKENALKCEREKGCKVITGGLESFIKSSSDICTHAIVAVGVEKLFETTKLLIESGVKNILVEKPGAMYKKEFYELNKLAQENNTNVLIAYNRRFYASVLKAQEIIKEDGGVLSFNFEFTEWAHVIEPLVKADGVKEKWLLTNSTHVIDLAFYLGGKPKELCTFKSGELTWHPTASIFSGAGVSELGALFNYHANWESAGRWSVEILTKEHRLILRPMEKLQIQKRGSVAQEFDESIDYTLDEKYKPGLYLQTKSFLSGEVSKFCTIEEQYNNLLIYDKISGYED